MSQTTGNQYPTVSSSLDRRLYQEYTHQFREQIIIIGLVGGLYGVLTILSITSAYALIIRRQRIQPTTIGLTFTILTLFTSTTSFLGGRGIWVYSPPVIFQEPSVESPYDSKAPLLAKTCASAATLTINVVLGDAIVWWRTCVIWHNNRIVRAICGFSLLATLALGAINAIQSCRPSNSFGVNNQAGPFSFLGTMFEGLPLGIAACVLSLSSNIFTTLLVAYKAWQSRRSLREYLVAKAGGSPVEKLLTLLVESGAIYSAIWAGVVAYQVGEFKYRYNFYMGTARKFGPESAATRLESPTELKFLDIFGVMMNGALVPVIAIYPAIIIVLVALNSSHMERGLTQHLESLPTPFIAQTVDTTATSFRESRLHRRSEVLVTGVHPQESRCPDIEDESEAEDASVRTSEEWKDKEVIHNRSPPNA